MRPHAAGWLLLVVLALTFTGAGLASAQQPTPSDEPTTIPLPPPSNPTAPTVEPTAQPPQPDPGDDEDEDRPGGVVGWIIDGIDHAITAFFRALVTAGLRPTLELVGHSLLATPTLDQWPRVGELWHSSRLLVVAAYGVLVMIGGLIVMARESIQTRTSLKEIAPRLVVAFLLSNMSLVLIDLAIALANALSAEVLGGVDPDQAADTMADLVYGSIGLGGLWMIFLALAIQTVAYVLMVTYVIRIAATVILIVAAPFALACHALPHTDPIARWWWRAFAALLGIQVLQSLTLAAAVRVFFAEGGFRFFGPVGDGLVNLLVTFALLYVLCKIPFWMWQHVQFGGGRSAIGGLVKAFVAYKTFGLLRSPSRGAPRRPGRRPEHTSSASPPARSTPLPSWSFPRREPPGGPTGSGPGPTRPTPTGPSPSGPRPSPRGTKPAAPTPEPVTDPPAATPPGTGRGAHHIDRSTPRPPPRPGRPTRPARPAPTRPPARPAPAPARARPLPADLRRRAGQRPPATPTRRSDPR